MDQTVSPTYEWSVNGYTLTGSSLDLSTIAIAVGDLVTCSATVLDSNGGQATAANSVTILNRDPSIDSMTISPSSPTTSDLMTCQSTTSDPDGDAVTVSTNWEVAGVNIGSQSSLQLDPTMVSPLDSLDCIITAVDSNGNSVTSTQSVSVVNSNPVIDSISISPDPAYVSDELICSVSVSDVDGEMPSVFIEFQDSQGVVLNSTTGSTLGLDISNSSVGSSDTVTCVVSIVDVYGGTDSSSSNLVISNSAPQFDVGAGITSDTGSVTTGSTLTCSASASDPNQGVVNLSYEWAVNGSIISSTDTVIVDANQTDVGNTIECVVTATDSDGESTTSNASELVLNTLPSISTVNIMAQAGMYNDSVVECIVTIVDPDESLSPSYIWQVAGGVVGTNITLDLATTAAMPTDQVTCIVNVLDSNGGSANDTTFETVLNRVPTSPTVSVSPSSPEEGVDSITCNIDVSSQDADGHSPSYTYQWDNNGSPSGYGSAVVPANALIGGDVWMCSVTPSDGIDSGSAGTASVTVASSSTVGQDSSNPGLDCDDILQQDPSAGDGTYWIAPNGSSPFQAYCLMSINGGGWTVQSYIRTQSQWGTGLNDNLGTVGDVAGGFASGSDLNNSNFQVIEKIVVYLRLIEGGNDMGTQWMVNYRSSPINYGSLTSNQPTWAFEGSFGGTSSDAGSVCSHGCSSYRGYGMFHSSTGIGYHGTQTGDYGCRDGNNICWSPRGYGCNVGSNRCSYLTGTGEGVIYAVK